MRRAGTAAGMTALLVMAAPAAPAADAPAAREMEKLGRGLVAVNQGEGKVFVGWRLLATDPDDIAFNLYRTVGDGKPVRLNKAPLTRSTSYADAGVDLARPNAWFVRPVLGGKEQEASAPFTLPANAPARPYL